jgi:hypothetical protein
VSDGKVFGLFVEWTGKVAEFVPSLTFVSSWRIHFIYGAFHMMAYERWVWCLVYTALTQKMAGGPKTISPGVPQEGCAISMSAL